jgi:hypothetical protein
MAKYGEISHRLYFFLNIHKHQSTWVYNDRDNTSSMKVILKSNINKQTIILRYRT